MVVNGRPLKRMKRRVTADLYDFFTFPVSGDGFSADLEGPFRSNIRSFLLKHALLPPPSSIFSPSVVPHMMTWQIVFRTGEIGGQGSSAASVVTLDVVEEDVTRSRSVYCDQCRVVGWSGHPVCGKRYHFIIRVEGRSIDDGYPHACPRCGDLLNSLDLRCKSCNYEMTMDDLEDWAYLLLEDSTHLLHGLVHTNGYGHLLRVNGREGGSKFLSGCDIMDFWDRLCKALRVRKVSVMDVSKKYGLEYRLLHAVTTGRPWYGDWGYKFGAGSFALTLDAYRKAVDSLSNLPLTLFFYNKRSSSSSRTRLQDVVSLYWSLSEWQLVTVRDLFRFVMGLLHDAHKQVAGCTMEKHRSAVLCPWTRDDIERVEHAMIRVLQVAGNGSRWVTRRALKGALCHSASPELLDYCLKELGGRSSKDGVVVCCRYNPETNAIEYRLEAGNNDSDSSAAAAAAADMCSNWPSEENLLRDLKFLYASLLHPETMTSSYKPQAIRDVSHSSAAKLLDCKQFVKDYESDQMVVINPFGIKISCQVELVDHPKDYTAPPPELLILPADATVSDLKFEATKAFQEVYVIFKRFQVEQLLDYGDVDDTTRVKFLVGSSGSVRVRGRCIGSYHGLHQFRMERGTDSWTVDCKCGARDDDGERMLACDACGVWQHTRCAGIRDIDVVPTKFVCDKCKCAIVGGASETTPPRPRKNNKTTAAGSGRLCKDELVVGVSGFDCLTMPFGVR